MDQVLNKAKAIAAAVAALVVLAKLALVDEAISFDEAEGLWTGFLALLGVVGVYRVRNRPLPPG